MSLTVHPTPRLVVLDSPLSLTDLQPGSSMMEFARETRLLMASAVVALTGCSGAKVYAMAVSGAIPLLRSGRSRRIPLPALERWVEKNTSGSVEP
jgi:excisionase family DNA binding protein